jgi:hypothetical protein
MPSVEVLRRIVCFACVGRVIDQRVSFFAIVPCCQPCLSPLPLESQPESLAGSADGLDFLCTAH